jgi:hypothetical protein
VWKFRDNKWQIVLGVFARIIDATPPSLKYKFGNKKPSKKS